MNITHNLKNLITGALVSGTLAVAGLGLAEGTANASEFRWCPGDPPPLGITNRRGWPRGEPGSHLPGLGHVRLPRLHAHGRPRQGRKSLHPAAVSMVSVPARHDPDAEHAAHPEQGRVSKSVDTSRRCAMPRTDRFGIVLDTAQPGVTKSRLRSLYEKDFRRDIRGRVARRTVRSDLGAPGIRSAWRQPDEQHHNLVHHWSDHGADRDRGRSCQLAETFVEIAAHVIRLKYSEPEHCCVGRNNSQRISGR